MAVRPTKGQCTADLILSAAQLHLVPWDFVGKGAAKLAINLGSGKIAPLASYIVDATRGVV